MTSFNADDHRYMARALQLAERGLYSTHPNPRVGCVLVRDGDIVGEGFHERAGEGHAEVNALAMAGARAQGATAYVTLEPCSHHGRTPPCAEGLLRAGVSRVISAMQDPNPLVGGRGHKRLSDAGIRVSWGLLQDQARALNPGFIKRMSTGLPYVRVKQAMSLDGRTGMQSGESQWITGAAARSDVQRLRARSSAILTGSGTVLHDNPSMTVRASQLGLDNAEAIARRQPLRVIMDSSMQTPADAAILRAEGETLIFHCDTDNNAADRAQQLQDAGATLVDLSAQADSLQPRAILRWLAEERECNELLIEAGATLSGAFTAAGLVDEWVIYIAPTLLGSEARPLFDLPGMSLMSQQLRLQQSDLRMLGEDIRIVYRPAAQTTSAPPTTSSQERQR